MLCFCEDGVPHRHLVPEKKASIRSPETEVADNCELSCGSWELNLGPLEEQPMLSTAELSLVSTAFLIPQHTFPGSYSTSPLLFSFTSQFTAPILMLLTLPPAKLPTS